MDTEDSRGLIRAPSMESLLTTIFKEQENTTGQTGENSMALGWTIKWRAVESSLGPTGGDTRASMWTTRKRATECFIGLMVGCTMEAGKMENNTELVHIHQPAARRRKASGKMVRGFNGCNDIFQNLLITYR